jgi:succinate dehydrogenase / fumarate reductase iron-sulfur subunit
MKIKIQRNQAISEYDIQLNDATLLEMLSYIKEHIDSSLAFSSGCRSSVCGSCAVRVNGKEVLACAYKPKHNDLVEPLRNMPVLRDLAVDMDKALHFNKIARAWGLPRDEALHVSIEDAKRNELQSDCILCSACFSACPVYVVNEEFIGPFALTRSLRYVNDVRQKDIKPIIESIQTNGIYDCTLCNECVPVCPQGIAPKQDIEMLRNKSGVMGYMNPNFSTGFDDGLNF